MLPLGWEHQELAEGLSVPSWAAPDTLSIYCSALTQCPLPVTPLWQKDPTTHPPTAGSACGHNIQGPREPREMTHLHHLSTIAMKLPIFFPKARTGQHSWPHCASPSLTPLLTEKRSWEMADRTCGSPGVLPQCSGVTVECSSANWAVLVPCWSRELAD